MTPEQQFLLEKAQRSLAAAKQSLTVLLLA